MSTEAFSSWDDRKFFIHQKWPLFTEKDLEILKKHPENIVIKLQKYYQYSKFEAYKAYFDLMNTDLRKIKKQKNPAESNQDHH